VAFERTDVSGENIASIIRVEKISELGTTLTVFINALLVTANDVPSSPILVCVMVVAIGSSETSSLQKSHGITSQKTAFFIVPAVKTLNLTLLLLVCEVLYSA
jgi:hypothetical protein